MEELKRVYETALMLWPILLVLLALLGFLYWVILNNIKMADRDHTILDGLDRRLTEVETVQDLADLKEDMYKVVLNESRVETK